MDPQVKLLMERYGLSQRTAEAYMEGHMKIEGAGEPEVVTPEQTQAQQHVMALSAGDAAQRGLKGASGSLPNVGTFAGAVGKGGVSAVGNGTVDPAVVGNLSGSLNATGALSAVANPEFPGDRQPIKVQAEYAPGRVLTRPTENTKPGDTHVIPVKPKKLDERLTDQDRQYIRYLEQLNGKKV